MEYQLESLSFEELQSICGGRMTPKEFLDKVGDWVADGIGWMVAMEGARVAGSVNNGGNAAAVVAFK